MTEDAVLLVFTDMYLAGTVMNWVQYIKDRQWGTTVNTVNGLGVRPVTLRYSNSPLC